MDANGLERRRLALAAAWLCGAGACAAQAAADEAPRCELAREAPADIDPAGYLVSEKCDGVRALWDGRRLRFRSGRAVQAPAWFVERLPAQPLDGELWMGRGRFDPLSAAVRRAQPLDAEWRALRYMVFELPGAPGPFAQRAAGLLQLAHGAGWAQLAALPQEPVADRAALQRRLAEVVNGGGEGLVLHRADAAYQAGRSGALLKLKPLQDAEATVIAQVPGQGRFAGLMGALRVRTPEGLEFLLGTGFSDAQRASPPPPGAIVTYSHRGRTPGGVPRFASFVRVRDDGA